MRSASGIAAAIFALALLACSEISGLELVVVGEAPPDIEAAIGKAAAAAGFVDADLSYPLDVKNAGAHFFKLPRKDNANPVTIQTGIRSGAFRIHVGRSIYADCSVAETAAASKFVSNLRESGVVLRKTWSYKLMLAKDIERWLEGNGKNEA